MEVYRPGRDLLIILSTFAGSLIFGTLLTIQVPIVNTFLDAAFVLFVTTIFLGLLLFIHVPNLPDSSGMRYFRQSVLWIMFALVWIGFVCIAFALFHFGRRGCAMALWTVLSCVLILTIVLILYYLFRLSLYNLTLQILPARRLTDSVPIPTGPFPIIGQS